MSRARAGDGVAFAELTEPFRRELHVHCYRMLGSLQDAEDALQDTLLSAWKGLDGFEARATLRTWLYRIATNRCLNARRAASRRPATQWHPRRGTARTHPPREMAWLEPLPDTLWKARPPCRRAPKPRRTDRIHLAGVRDRPPGPAAPPGRGPDPARRARFPRGRSPRCSTRPSNRSTARSSARVRACGAPGPPPTANPRPPPNRRPRKPSSRNSSTPTTPPTSTRWSPC